MNSEQRWKFIEKDFIIEQIIDYENKGTIIECINKNTGNKCVIKCISYKYTDEISYFHKIIREIEILA